MPKRLLPILLVTAIVLVVPTKTDAIIHFGGSIQILTPCVNGVVYTVLGPPRGGMYLWSPIISETYSFGPPSHPGQWLLGNAGPSYFCIVSVLPLIILPGWLIMTMGSSQ